MPSSFALRSTDLRNYFGGRMHEEINMPSLSFKNIIVRADSPIKRMGLIFITLSILFWIAMVIHWNIYHHGFIYDHWESWTEQVSRPQDTKVDIWVRGVETLENFTPSQVFLLDERPRRSGWVSYDRACLKSNHRPLSFFELYP